MRMDDVNEILWRFYQENVTHGRHHETLRATTTTLLLAVAAGVLGLLGASHRWPLGHQDIPLCVFLIILGIFGAFFSAKYRERFEFHMNRAREYRNALDKSLPAAKINERRPLADQRTKKKYPWLYDRELWHFWMSLHILIAILGVTLTVGILLP
jgi:hypothetical protein